MSTESTISMRELEAESAELLPSRETLCRPRCGGSSHGGFNLTQFGQNNSAQFGLVNLNVQDVNIGNISL